MPLNTLRLFYALTSVVALTSGFTSLPSNRIAFSSRQSFSSLSASSSLVVISPPGGVGEVAAVQAATMGNTVKWFVVSREKEQQQVPLSPQTLEDIDAAGGSVELAGADAPSLMLPVEDPASAIQAVSAWCGAADSIVCTFDGVDAARKAKTAADEDPAAAWKDAIKIAAREASSSVRGKKIAILSATEDDEVDSASKRSDGGGGLGGLVGNLFGNQPNVPSSLSDALGGSNVLKLRHGELFGLPESSPDFSPLVGGPRKIPELCEEYTMRSVRVDPTLSVSGNMMMGRNTRSCRHVVGEAAALLASGQLSISGDGDLDVCLSSQTGTEGISLEEWQQEFDRVSKVVTSTSVDGAPELFSADFASVPDVDRLADWLATKWAPAVLRTYDIAAIRVGARPVYATRGDDGKVEIVWQQLVDFSSVTVGKMIIEVSESKLVARRGAGDASKGFGTISRKPLAGEDVLVRLLAEAYSQAVEKGLAKKPMPKKSAVKAPAPEIVPVTSIQSSGTVAVTDDESVATPSRSDQGPRQAGARRSTERKRGKRKKSS